MIEIGRKYTLAEMAKFRDQLPGLKLRGYVMRMDDDGMVSFVHWKQASGGGATEDGRPALGPRVFQGTPDFGELPPIKRRTPQERLDSLASRLSEDMRAGRVMTDQQIADMTAQAWRKGQPVTGDAIRAVASALMHRAEKDNKNNRDRTPEVQLNRATRRALTRAK